MKRSLLSLRSSTLSGFAYTPPDTIYRKDRVLLITGDVDKAILREVIMGFWRMSPTTRLLVVESDALEPNMLGANMRAVDLDTLPKRPFVSRLNAGKFVMASPLLAEVDACFTLVSSPTALPAEPPSLSVMASLSPVPVSPLQAYLSLGHLFAGAAVHFGDKVLWGDDPLEVDRAVYRTLQQPTPQSLNEVIEAAKALEKIR